MKYLLVIFLSANAFAHADKFGNVDKFGSKAKEIKIDVGGLVILEQLMVEENLGDTALLSFKCDRPGKKTKCQLLRIDAAK